MEEKRRLDRYKVTKIIAYEAPGEMIKGKCLSKDIGTGGIRLRLSSNLKVGAKLKMKIGIFRGSPPVDAEGRIVWRKEIGGAGKEYFCTGVSFAGLSDSDRDGIMSLVIDRCQAIQDAPGAKIVGVGRERR